MTATVRRDDSSHGRNRRAALATLARALAALAAAAAAAAPAAQAHTAKPSALPAFHSCKSLLSYARSGARRTGGGVGVPTRAGALGLEVLNRPTTVAVDGARPLPSVSPAVPATSSEGAAKAAPSFSSTNVQEVGIDEPDIVKTDGRRVFAVGDGTLYAVDVTGATPRLVGSLALDGYAQQLLIRGDRVLVLSTDSGAVPLPAAGKVAGEVAFRRQSAVLTEVDVSDPAAMVVRRTMALDGAIVDARLTGGTARVVVVSSPGYVEPQSIASTGVRRYVPRTTLHSEISKRTFRRSVVPCDDVRHPRTFSGLDLLTVLTVDLDKGLFNVDRDAILAGAQTVYGSPTTLYVASQKYLPAAEDGRALPARPRTQIHRFDASQDGKTSYAGSGEVAGFVLNQYSLSEYDGALRVASTDEPQWFEGTLRGDSESFVTVLGTQGSTLRPLGKVAGLGRGERIYAVRFVGDKGYVVTFRQVDPLYTLDLSDKARPRVLGELKILGYSAYLHPVSDDLLLGVGQDASAEGRRLGTQLSLFDVSDLRRPVRRAQASLGANASTTAEFDPHAFLFWKPANLAVIPLSVYGSAGPGFQGAVGFRVGAASLTEAGRITHPAEPDQASAPPIARSLVIDGTLYTLSYAGLRASSLDTLAALSFAAFPVAPREPMPDLPIAAPRPVP